MVRNTKEKTTKSATKFKIILLCPAKKKTIYIAGILNSSLENVSFVC
jgi:hypothetical protein